jgi:hypothetical protein
MFRLKRWWTLPLKTAVVVVIVVVVVVDLFLLHIEETWFSFISVILWQMTIIQLEVQHEREIRLFHFLFFEKFVMFSTFIKC